MDANELLKKVRKIEIKTKTLSRDQFAGSYHTNFKGRGMAFSEVREYQTGDEVRTIDWNVTARLGNPYIKVFEEEREISLMLLADISASGNFSSKSDTKRDIITYISAIIAFSASQNQDKTGLLLFSDKVERYIVPKKGKSHILRIIRDLIEVKPESNNTNIAKALSYTLNMLKKRSIVFILSDFMDSDFEKQMEICAAKHETIAIRIYDPAEEKLPKMGMLNVKDAESGKVFLLDTNSAKLRRNYAENMENRKEYLRGFFAKNKIAYIEISTEDDYVLELMKYFNR